MFRILFVVILSGCASYQNMNNLYNRPSSISPQVQKEMYEQIDTLKDEPEKKLKSRIIGDVYITSNPLCNAMSLEDYAGQLANNEKVKQDRIESKFGSPSFTKKEAFKVEPLSKVTVKDLKFVIHPHNMDSTFNEKTTKWEHKWDGGGSIYLTVSQKGSDFVVDHYVMKYPELIAMKNFFYDSKEAGTSTFDCLAKNDPVKHFRLSAKDIKSIKDGSYYLGMRSTPLHLSLGKPTKINSTTSKYANTSQWVYGSNYIYFRNGVISSWQN